jgi:hypothetical protein
MKNLTEQKSRDVYSRDFEHLHLSLSCGIWEKQHLTFKDYRRGRGNYGDSALVFMS